MVTSAIKDIVGNEKTPSWVSWVVKNAIMGTQTFLELKQLVSPPLIFLDTPLKVTVGIVGRTKRHHEYTG